MIEYTKQIKISSSLVNGYEYFCDVNHPLVNSQGYIYYHRHVASMKVGRWIEKDEHVHHIDGNRLNNSPDNLDVLSPSEHQKIEAINRGRTLREDHKCLICGKQLYPKGKGRETTDLCQKCYSKSIRKFDPSREELEDLVWRYPTIKVAEMFGVSDKAVEKRCKILGISKPPRGYWTRVKSVGGGAE